MPAHLKSNDSRGARAWRIVFAISLVVFVAALAVLGVMAFSYFQGQVKYAEIAKSADFDPVDVEGKQLEQVTVDWSSLIEANGDTVAWLLVPNTDVNYPVVRGDDNEYYLTHDFDGEAGWLANYGAVFMDYRNNPDWSDQSYFIYGHHMNDGSMFADLAGLADQARFDECRTIYLLSPTGNFRLRTFAMLHVSADDEIVQANFSTPGDMASYVRKALESSVVDPGDVPAAGEMEKVFAFATCDNQFADGRYILFAYVDETTAEGLAGTLGMQREDGQAVGFANDLSA